MQIGTRNITEGTTNVSQSSAADQSTLTSITTDGGESTLVPDSPPPRPSVLPFPLGPGVHSATRTHSRPVVPDLTITDLLTTTMSSGVGESATEPPPLDPCHRIIHTDAHRSSSEDSDSSISSSSANTETPPPELRYSTVQPVHMRTHTPRTISSRSTTSNTTSTSAAQKVHFSHSVERREGARRGGSRLTTAGQPGIEIGDISSGQLKLGLDAHAAGSRANVLATLYQNYLRDVNTAHPVTKGAPKVATGESKKTRTTTESKLKSYPQLKSKVSIWIQSYYAYLIFAILISVIVSILVTCTLCITPRWFLQSIVN